MKNTIFITLLFMNFALFGQEQNPIPDSLKGKSYEELRKGFKNNMQNNKEVAEVYARAYLKRGKREKDTVQIIEGYNLMIKIKSHSKFAVQYADSVISITKSSKHVEYRVDGYLKKGIQLYYLSINNKALNNFLIADKLSKNKFKKLQIYHYIGLLNNIEGNAEKYALTIFKKNILYFKDKTIDRNIEEQYFKSLFALSDSYIRNKLPDSAIIYSKIGIINSLKKNNNLYPYFVLSYGLAQYFKNNYEIALDSLIKGCDLINDKDALCDTYMYISNIHKEEKRDDLSIKYLLKIDSIFTENPQVYFRARDANKQLLGIYREKSNSQKQIQIIDKLITIDSIIKTNNQDLEVDLIKKYETPKLLKQKESIIKSLKKSTNSLNITIKLFSLFILLLISLLLFTYYKHHLFKRRYNLLIEKHGQLKENRLKTKAITGISKEQVSYILKKIKTFEENLGFLDSKITLATMAVQLKTNSSYLSKVINHHKKCSFSTYLNEIRIDYFLKTIPKEKILQQYTIKALAKEFGFNNAESFSKAFYNQTKIYPSFYIKQVKKNKRT